VQHVERGLPNQCHQLPAVAPLNVFDRDIDAADDLEPWQHTISGQRPSISSMQEWRPAGSHRTSPVLQSAP
jgi:hypothetical protein